MIRYIHVYLSFSLSPRNNGILKDHCREKTVLITNRRNSNNGDFRHYSRHWEGLSGLWGAGTGKESPQ